MSESEYYEDASIWAAERYLANDAEMARYRTTAGLVPAECRTLLDVGTGNGAFLHVLESTRPELTVRGVDRSRAAVGAAVCAGDVDVASIDALPYPDRSFDAVTCLEVVEHLPGALFRAGLDEIARVAKNHVVISVPFRERRRNVRCPDCGCEFNPSYHMRSFDERIMSGLLPGFRVVHHELLTRPEYVVIQPLLAEALFASNRLRRRLPANALCPQCGFRSPVVRRPIGPPPPAGSIRRAVRALLPKRERAAWIATLYERAG